MKRSTKLICILLTILFTLSTVPFSALADTSKDPAPIEMPEKKNVLRYKEFTIRFSDSIEEKDILPGQIYVLDSDNNPKQIHIENGYDKMSLIIKPAGSGYIPGKTYTLWLKGIKTRTGHTLKKPVKMKFSIQEYPQLTSDSLLLPQVKLLPSEGIFADQEKNTVTMSLEIFEKQKPLSIGTVIVQESTPSKPFGFVGKITKINRFASNITISTANPRLEEVYDTIRLFENIDILTKGISIPEATLPYLVEDYFDVDENRTLSRLKYILNRQTPISTSDPNFILTDGVIYLEKPRLEYNIKSFRDLSWKQLERADFSITGRLRYHLNLSASGGSNSEKMNLRGNLGTITIPLGAPGFSAELSFEFQSQALVTAPINTPYEIEAGTAYQIGFRKEPDGECVPVTELLPYLDSQLPTQAATQSASSNLEMSHRFDMSAKLHFLKDSINNIPELGLKGTGSVSCNTNLKTDFSKAATDHTLKIQSTSSVQIDADGKSVTDAFGKTKPILDTRQSTPSTLTKQITRKLDKIIFDKEEDYLRKWMTKPLKVFAVYVKESVITRNNNEESRDRIYLKEPIPHKEIQYSVLPDIATVDEFGKLKLKEGEDQQPFDVQAKAYEKTCSMKFNPIAPSTPYADFHFDADNGSILSYNGTARSVIIPATIQNIPVRQIGAHAFDRRYLTSVVIPDSVTVIHESAFANNLLPHIELPKNLISIGSNAFTGNRLTNITIPNSVRSIGHSAFSKNFLYHVQLSNALSAIEHHTFNENKLQHIEIPSLVTDIGDSAFAYNEIESITFAGHTANAENSSLNFIGKNAFRNNYIQRLRLPDSIDTVEAWAFAHNEIRELTLPSKIRHIYSNAFRYNNLAAFRILIPASLVDSLENVFDPEVEFIRK